MLAVHRDRQRRDAAPITEVARETLGIEADHLVPYGHYKAKVDLGYLATLEDRRSAS